MSALGPFKLVSTDLAPVARGHYSQALVANGIVYVSGQLPFVPGKDAAMPEGIKAQAGQALQNVRQILKAAGSSVDRILSVKIFVTNVESWLLVNEVYINFMGAHRPARTVVPVSTLHMGALIEINAMAAVGDRRG